MPTLIIQDGLDRRGGTFEWPLLIGSCPANAVMIADNSVAHVHAWIGTSSQGFFVANVNKNGRTFVNGIPVQGKRLLASGDMIQVGGTVKMTYLIEDALPKGVRPVAFPWRAPNASAPGEKQSLECGCGATIVMDPTPAKPANGAAKPTGDQRLIARSPEPKPEAPAPARRIDPSPAPARAAVATAPLATAPANGHAQPVAPATRVQPSIRPVRPATPMPSPVSTQAAAVVVEPLELREPSLEERLRAKLPKLQPEPEFAPVEAKPAAPAAKPAPAPAPVAFVAPPPRPVEPPPAPVKAPVTAPVAVEVPPAPAPSPAAAPVPVAVEQFELIEADPDVVVMKSDSAITPSITIAEPAAPVVPPQVPPAATIDVVIPEPEVTLSTQVAVTPEPEVIEELAPLAPAAPPEPPPRAAAPAVDAEVVMCAICQSQINTGEEMTGCPECGLTFHADCWTENCGCAAYGCSQVGVLAPPDTTPVKQVDEAEFSDPFPWEFLLLGGSVLSVVAGALAFGALSALLGVLTVWMALRTGLRRWPLLAGSAAMCVLGVVVGLEFSKFWWLGWRPFEWVGR